MKNKFGKGTIFVIPPGHSSFNIIILLERRTEPSRKVWSALWFSKEGDYWEVSKNFSDEEWLNRHSQYIVEGKKQWN